MAAERQAVKRKQEGVDNNQGCYERAQVSRNQHEGGHHPGRGRGLPADEGTVGLAPVGDAPDGLIRGLAAEDIDHHRPGPPPPALEQAVDDQARPDGEGREQEKGTSRFVQRGEASTADQPDQTAQQSQEQNRQADIGALPKGLQHGNLTQGETRFRSVEQLAGRQVQNRKGQKKQAERDHRGQAKHDGVVGPRQGRYQQAQT